MRSNIKVLVVGDQGVGKSTLISTYISNLFLESVPTIMTDMVFTSKLGTNMILMDSSVYEGDAEVLTAKIRLADSIIVLYDVSKPESLTSIREYWLKEINAITRGLSGKHFSVLICGTKSDLSNTDVGSEQENQTLIDILKTYPFVLSCFRCSSKNRDVESVFYHSEISILFPLWPIYNIANSTFTDVTIIAFMRIFRAFDYDKDGLLNDQEIIILHETLFDETPEVLTIQNVYDLKQQINTFYDALHPSTSILKLPPCLINNSLTFDGFLAMNALFIESFKPHVPWIMLRKFGYDDSLELPIPPELLIPPECNSTTANATTIDNDNIINYTDNTELSPGAHSFLYHLGLAALKGNLPQLDTTFNQSCFSKSNIVLTSTLLTNNNNSNINQVGGINTMGVQVIDDNNISSLNLANNTEDNGTNSTSVSGVPHTVPLVQHTEISSNSSSTTNTTTTVTTTATTATVLRQIFSIIHKDIDHPWNQHTPRMKTYSNDKDQKYSVFPSIHSLYPYKSISEEDVYNINDDDDELRYITQPVEINEVLWGQYDPKTIMKLNSTTSPPSNTNISNSNTTTSSSSTSMSMSTKLKYISENNTPEYDCFIVNSSSSPSSSSSSTDSFSIHEWMCQWQLLAMYRPIAVQVLLYLLGYLYQNQDDDYGVIPSHTYDTSFRSRCIRVGVLGDNTQNQVEWLSYINRIHNTHFSSIGSTSTSNSNNVISNENGDKISENNTMKIHELWKNSIFFGGCIWWNASYRQMNRMFNINYANVTSGNTDNRRNNLSISGNNNNNNNSSNSNIMATHIPTTSYEKNLYQNTYKTGRYLLFEIIPFDYATTWINNNKYRIDAIIMMYTHTNTNTDSTIKNTDTTTNSNINTNANYNQLNDVSSTDRLDIGKLKNQINATTTTTTTTATIIEKDTNIIIKELEKTLLETSIPRLYIEYLSNYDMIQIKCNKETIENSDSSIQTIKSWYTLLSKKWYYYLYPSIFHMSMTDYITNEGYFHHRILPNITSSFTTSSTSSSTSSSSSDRIKQQQKQEQEIYSILDNLLLITTYPSYGLPLSTQSILMKYIRYQVYIWLTITLTSMVSYNYYHTQINITLNQLIKIGYIYTKSLQQMFLSILKKK